MASSLLFLLMNLPRKCGSIYSKESIHSTSKTLKIVFSSIPQRPMLRSLDGDVLWLYENKLSTKWTKNSGSTNLASGGWFFGDISGTLRMLTEKIQAGSWKNVVCIGSSKSGYAAILFSHFLSIRFPKKNVSTLTFSPATYLQSSRSFEFDTAPSLAQLKEVGAVNDIFAQYGDLHKVLEDTKIKKLTIVYSKAYPDDYTDFKRLCKLPCVSGVEIAQAKMAQFSIHPHLTLEYVWKHDRALFEKLLSSSS